MWLLPVQALSYKCNAPHDPRDARNIHILSKVWSALIVYPVWVLPGQARRVYHITLVPTHLFINYHPA